MSSWLSKGIHGLGHLAEKAAPYVGLIPGVGTVAGGLIGAAGGLAAGDGLGGALKYGALGAAGGYGGAALRGSSLGAKALAVGSAAMHGGVPSVSGGGAMSEGDPSGGVHLDPNTGLEVMNEGSGGGGIGGYLSKALGGMSPIEAGLGAAGVINAGQLQGKANKFANNAYGSAAGSYAERAGLRKQGIAGLMAPQQPDLSNLTKIRSQNPYSGVAA